MKILKRILLVLAILILVIFAVVYTYLYYQSPKYSGQKSLAGLQEPVEILFDEFGIPHIYGKNPEDTYYALGYVQAQERLFQMDLYRKLVQGRASEVFGAALIPTDTYFLTLGLNKLATQAAERHFGHQPEQPYEKPVQAYLKGVNAFIETGNLPIEFLLLGYTPEPFQVEDVFASINLTALGFSFAQKEDLLVNFIYNQLGTEYFTDFSKDFYQPKASHFAPVEQLMSKKLDKAMSAMGLPLWEGSNSWVLAPSKTKSHKAILANDTHIGFSQPAVWYEAYLNYPGYEFYGSFLPSVPFGVLGHNRNLAWGLTIFPFDNMDYYKLQAAGGDEKYVYFNDTLSMENIDFAIKVKGTENHKFSVKTSKFGPIVNSLDEIIDSLYQDPIALCWSVYHLNHTSVEALYKLNMAQNMADFQAALPLIDIVGLNVMYADAEDNIAWWGSGKIPLRDSLSESFMFLNSANSVDELKGFMSFDENPHVVNPPSGFITTANNNPELSGGRFVPGNYLPSDRVQRITTKLEEHNNWDAATCRALQLDHQSTVKRDLAHLISLQLNQLPAESRYVEISQKLGSWDGQYDLQAFGPVVFERMYYHIARLALADELGEALFNESLSSYLLKKSLPVLIQNEQSPWWKTAGKETTRNSILNEAFITTVDELTAELGNDISKWKWSQVHTLTHEHPMGSQKPLDQSFNVGPFPVPGGNQVLNKMEHNLSNQPIHKVGSGPAVRMIVDFAEVDEALNITPTGQSGNFRSKHYSDQAEMFVKGEYRGMIMDKAKLQKSKNQVLILNPKK